MANIVEIIARLNGIDQVKSGFQEMSRSMQDFGSKMTSIGQQLSVAITAPIAGLGGMALKLAGDMEQSRIAFTTMLGSAEKAGKYLEDLAEFSKRTPFEFVGLQAAAKRMMAYGFAAEQVLPILERVGSAAAGLGLGQQGIDRITLALGQMQAKAKVSGEEMRQLAEAGIPAWQAIADVVGVTVPEAMKLAEKGAIDATTGINAILEAMDKKFGGLMAKQAGTVLGSFSNVQDSFKLMMVDIGDSITKAFDIGGKLSKVVVVLDTFRSWWKNLDESTKTYIVTVGALVSAIGPLLLAIGGLIKIVTILGSTMALVFNLNPYILAIGALIAAGVALYMHWDTVRDYAVKKWAEIKFAIIDNMVEATEFLRKYVGGFFDTWIVTGALDKMKELREEMKKQMDLSEKSRVQNKYMKELNDFLEQNQQGLKKAGEETKKLDIAGQAAAASMKKIQEELQETLKVNAAMAEVMGPDFKKSEQDLDAYTKAFTDMIKAGASPASAAMANLRQKIDELGVAIAMETASEKASEEQKERLRKALEDVSEAFKQAKTDGDAYQYMLEQQSEAMNKAADPYRIMSEEMSKLQDLYDHHGLSIEALSQQALSIWERMADSMGTQTQKQIAHYEELGKRGVMTQQEVTSATKQALDEYEKVTGKKLKETEDHWADLKKAIEGWSKDFTNKLYDALGGGKAAFKDFFTTIMEQMSKLMLQKFITNPLLEWVNKGLNGGGKGGGLGSIFSSSGGLGSIFSSSGGLGGGLSYLGSMGSSLLSSGAFGNFFNAGLLGNSGFAAAGASLEALFHEGGPVTQYAPRYHSGYASDEVKAVLQTGEGVLNRKGMKALGQLNDGNSLSGGGGGQPINLIIQAMDAQSFSEYTKRNADAILAPVLESMRRSGAMRDMMLFTT